MYLKESQDLALILNEEFSRKTTLKKWGKGVYQARFAVLWRTAMPCILVEAGFISNNYEAKKLKTKSFRQKIAEAIYESILKFKRKYEKGIG